MLLQNSRGRCWLVWLSLLLGACAGQPPTLPEPLIRPRAERFPEELQQTVNVQNMGSAGTTGIQSTPKPPAAGALSTLKPATPQPPAGKEKADISVNFDQMPLPSFVQAVYGAVLKKNYSMDPQVGSRKDLVTLRSAQLQTPSQIENAARLLLKTYGVAVTDLGGGNYRITPDNSQTGYAPEILRGRALPEVPLPLRPIYQLVELRAVRSSELVAWLTKIFGTKVGIIDDAAHNTLIVSGQSDDVTAVLGAIDVLDQPLMKGRQSQRINPVFWSADELAKKLGELLTSEGYGVTTSAASAGQFPINLVPIVGINALIVFAADPAVMQHIVDWAKELDRPNTGRSSGGGYFTYQVRYTNAETLAKTMQAVLGQIQAAPALVQAAGTQPAATAAVASAKTSTGSVVVNTATNTIIFQGSNQNHTQLLSLLQELDKPARSALIEVTVAEVSLDNTTQMGVEWALNASGATGTVGGTLPGIAVGSAGTTTGIGNSTSGLTIARLSSAGDLRLLVNMLATSSKANVLSTPRVLARNGEAASIQVGSEIPTVSQQQTTAATGNTGVISSIQYRKTGVILTIKPIIYAGDRIDLDVTQEVSDSTKTGVASSPIIDTRKVETHLSLKDGTAVLLGGLISQNNSRTETGVPYLKDLPMVGQLFRTNTDTNRRTEMLVLITPYIVADDHDAREITDAFRNRVGEWAQPIVPAAPAAKRAVSEAPAPGATLPTAPPREPGAVNAPPASNAPAPRPAVPTPGAVDGAPRAEVLPLERAAAP